MREKPGADGSTSWHLIEKDAEGNTVSVVHEVESPEGEIIHQHQVFPSQAGTNAVYEAPEEWVNFPTIG